MGELSSIDPWKDCPFGKGQDVWYCGQNWDFRRNADKIKRGMKGKVLSVCSEQQLGRLKVQFEAFAMPVHCKPSELSKTEELPELPVEPVKRDSSVEEMVDFKISLQKAIEEVVPEYFKHTEYFKHRSELKVTRESPFWQTVDGVAVSGGWHSKHCHGVLSFSFGEGAGANKSPLELLLGVADRQDGPHRPSVYSSSLVERCVFRPNVDLFRREGSKKPFSILDTTANILPWANHELWEKLAALFPGQELKHRYFARCDAQGTTQVKLVVETPGVE